MARETIRYDADTIWIRYGYGATRYDTLVHDNDGSLPPDRVREPIKCSAPTDWSLSEATIPMSLVFAMQGTAAAVGGSWQQKVGVI